jgi:hypothetical protein
MLVLEPYYALITLMIIKGVVVAFEVLTLVKDTQKKRY